MSLYFHCYLLGFYFSKCIYYKVTLTEITSDFWNNLTKHRESVTTTTRSNLFHHY